jgi:DnaJ-class molecular chaperone
MSFLPRSREQLLALPQDATYFELLGISPHSAERMSLLTEARRAVAKLMHPDRDPSPEGAEVMARANAAFDVLARVASTKQYLALLRSTHIQCVPCEGEGMRKHQIGFKNVVFHPCSACQGMGYFRKARI